MINTKNKAIRWSQNALKKLQKDKICLVKFRRYEEKPVQKEVQNAVKRKFKQGWRTIGNRKIYFRSKWEANVGHYLQWQKEQKIIEEWFHEPQTFWFNGIKRGCVSYLPDFKVISKDGTHVWIEVKGFMDKKSATKIKRFKKYFPEETLYVFGEEWFKLNAKHMSLFIPAWE